jgi:hypothetical protein
MLSDISMDLICIQSLPVHARAGRDHTYYWYDTPLDFLNPESTYFEVAWRYCLNILSAMLMLSGDQPRPIRRRRDDNFPALSHGGMVILVLCGILSWGSNLVAWNFDFPTILERRTWRACSLILVATVMIGELHHEMLLQFFPDMKREACDRFAASKRSIVIYKPKPPLTEKFAETRKAEQATCSSAFKHFSKWRSIIDDTIEGAPASSVLCCRVCYRTNLSSGGRLDCFSWSES